MLRVAYVFERFPSFGQTFCYREVAELERQGAEVTVFSIRRPTGEPRQDWNDDLVGRVRYLPDEPELVKEIDRAARSRQLPEQACRALRDWDRQTDFLRLYQAAHIGLQLRKQGIERVHAHFAGMAARTAYWINQFFGIGFSVTAHANDIFAPRNFAVGLTKIFDAATAVVTVSDFAVARLQEQFPQDHAKIHRVYNGVHVADFAPADFNSSPPLIVSIGRLIEKKGFADLVEVCRLLREQGTEFRCEIIGDGPLEAALVAQIAAVQLSDRVRLSGPRAQSEIAGRLRAANVFSLPCTREADGGMDNLPTVIMEAMAAGVPVVSTAVAGVPEMVVHNVTGELVAPGDIPALAAAIARLISDRRLAATYGENGRARAAEKFSIENNVRALSSVLQQRA